MIDIHIHIYHTINFTDIYMKNYFDRAAWKDLEEKIL